VSLVHLGQSSQLQTLRMSGNNTPLKLEGLAFVQTLRVFDCSHCKHLSDVPSSMPALVDLDSSYATPAIPLQASAFTLNAPSVSCPYWLRNTGLHEDSPWLVGAAECMGLRPSMEDAWRLARLPTADIFVLCDGHGSSGAEVATHVAERLITALSAEAATAPSEQTLSQCVEQCAAWIKGNGLPAARLSGTTVLAVISHRATGKLHCINVGDTRALLCFKGHATRLTEDHRPTLQSEELRIRDAGGFVVDGRVNGSLGVSRSLGDQYLQPSVCALPSYSCTPWAPAGGGSGKLWLVLACDGVFDELNDEDVASLLASMPLTVLPSAAAAAVRDAALLLGSLDNISVICASMVVNV
jgi:serine/threonine protein phosphatase PrpC